MTAVPRLSVRRFAGVDLSRQTLRSPAILLTAAAAVNAVVFLLVRPPVGDLWAARARQSAATNGVGLGYWFSWFSGGSTPGNYSVLVPYLSTLLGAALLGALATVAITPLTAVLVRGTAHPAAATAVSAVVAGISLWSGRVPFAVGTAVSVLAFIAVRRQLRVASIVFTALTALISPVSAAFLVMGLGGLFLVSPRYRLTTAIAGGAGLASLVTISLVFGMPGPQPFGLLKSGLLAAALGLLLFARPAEYLRVVIVVAMVICPVLAIIPNGMGSNFQRLVWICLPVAVVATGTARLAVIWTASALSILLGAQTTVSDLIVSAQPGSSEQYYAGLEKRLDRMSALKDSRVEIVQDGTHTAAYALLGHAMLARGYETQEDHARNAVLMSPTLDAVSFKVWLDNNAVGFVAINRRTPTANPEDTLVRLHRPVYLTVSWSDANWVLYRVVDATPVVSSPASVIAVDQASMTISVPRPGEYLLRVHWSRFLKLSSPTPQAATIVDDGFGFTRLTAKRPGRYTLHG